MSCQICKLNLRKKEHVLCGRDWCLHINPVSGKLSVEAKHEARAKALLRSTSYESVWMSLVITLEPAQQLRLLREYCTMKSVDSIQQDAEKWQCDDVKTNPSFHAQP